MSETQAKIKYVTFRVVEELWGLAKDMGQVMDDIAFTPYGQLRIHKIPRSTYYDKLNKFEKHGLVKKTRKSYGNVYTLTDKAKILRRNPRIKVNRKDGLSTIIMFDIPEEKHKARDNFRRYLLKNGYTQIQKSVFLSPFIVSGELMEFIDELKLNSNVTFVSGKIDYLIRTH